MIRTLWPGPRVFLRLYSSGPGVPKGTAGMAPGVAPGVSPSAAPSAAPSVVPGAAVYGIGPGGPGGPDGKPPRPTLAERFVNALPKSAQPYARLSRMDKPIGTWLLYAPCTWSLTMGSVMAAVPPATLGYYLGVYLLGAWLTRGAGCTINDIWDRDLDRGVARTTTRPLAAGDVTTRQAVAWLGVQGVASLGVLASLPRECWAVGALSIAPVLVYPLFKRFTYYPQIWLSIWFSWGTVMGFPALGLSLTNPTVLATATSLLTSAFSWSMIYDTIYGHQDKKDDIRVGVKSTALKWGARTKKIAYRFWGLQSLSLIAAGSFAGMGPGFLTGAIVAMGNLLRMIVRVDLNNPASCGQFFKKNLKNGVFIWAGALLDYYMMLSFFFYQV